MKTSCWARRNRQRFIEEYHAPPNVMPKVSLDMPDQLKMDLEAHVGDHGKFVSLADAIRTACRKMLDHLDDVDARHGRIGGER